MYLLLRGLEKVAGPCMQIMQIFDNDTAATWTDLRRVAGGKGSSSRERCPTHRDVAHWTFSSTSGGSNYAQAHCYSTVE